MAAKQKILIVDDDNNIAELISLYLTKECFETMIVGDGESALETIKTFDLLLGDNLDGRKEFIATNGGEYLDLADIS